MFHNGASLQILHLYIAAGANSIHSLHPCRQPQWYSPYKTGLWLLLLQSFSVLLKKQILTRKIKDKNKSADRKARNRSTKNSRGSFMWPFLIMYVHTYVDHLGEKSWRGVKGELLEEGETPSILAGEPEEEPTLLRLPSSNSGDKL